MKTILVVDDSPTIRDLVKSTLVEAGYTVVEAYNGPNALTKLEELALAKTKVHLVMCDVNMPDMSGITLVKKIKEQDDYKYVPVVMVTTEYSKEAKSAAREAGAIAWIRKPWTPEALVASVRKLLML